ncbi:hypothetical protein [Microbacterium testaceum]|uniref:hypothetical protein n=1 Tax=Microbacterium testaceum TaxID=2033 RepID=UPI0025B055BE|nr:hypothetical protein [Microbacterium testaceum]WJS89635.1 hypothetical protein NYQ11_09800 [Microbacterium testaceum]
MLAVDTGIVAATNALVLIVSARLFEADDLTAITMAQLLVVTIVGLQRATFLTPAFASQRGTGRTVLPLTWLVWITFPAALVWSLVVPVMMPSGGLAYVQLFLVSAGVSYAALAQDLLRFALFTRLRPTFALVSDGSFLLFFCALSVAIHMAGLLTWTTLFLAWGLSAAGASCIALLLVLTSARRGGDVANVRIRDVMPLGKWSGSDAALSGAANLLPMAVSTLALGSPVAAIYRILQTANGPFNILSTTFITSVGMDAWKLDDLEEVKALRRRVIRQTFILTALAAVFYALAYPLIIFIAGIPSSDTIRVAIILGVSGVLGAATIPVNAAATAMGYQRVGFLVRVIVVLSALGISLLALSGAWIPWSDPVGIVAIISSFSTLAGWAIGYERGYRKELM